MYTVYIKMSAKKVLVSVGVLALVIGGIVAVRSVVDVQAVDVGLSSDKSLELSAADKNEVRVQFLDGLGWQVSAEPLEIEEVVIPLEFDATYDKYNKLQIEQGFDLSDYMGQRVKRYTYAVYNYPGEKDTVRANLLISDGKLIAGDVSSVKLDGFMQGLRMPAAGFDASSQSESLSAS